MKTNKKTSGLVSLMALVMCFGLVGTISALDVPDGDFETPLVAGGAGNWQYVNDMGGAWTSNYYAGSAWVGNDYSYGGFYPGLGHSGDQWVDMNAAYLSQALTDTYQEGATYELSIWATTSYGAEGLYFYFLDATGSTTGWAGATALASTPFVPITSSTDHTWYQYSFEYTATAAAAGKPIGIAIYGRGNTWADDVTLEIAGGVPSLIYPVSEDNTPWDLTLEWAAPLEFTPGAYYVYLDPNQANVTAATEGSDPGAPGDPLLLKVQDSDPNYAVTGLVHGETYYWKVEARQDPLTTPPTDPNWIPSAVASFSTLPDVPLITVQPEDQTVAASDPATFTVVSPNATGYQWKKYVDGLDDPNVGIDSGTLTISNALEINEGFYYCAVSNTSGTLLSDQARLWTERLIGYWPMDNNADDAVVDIDGPIDGVIFGDPNWVGGITNQAINLEAHPTDPNKDDYVVLGDASDLNFRTSTDFTVSLWIKAASLDNEAAIISNKDWDSGSNTGWLISGSSNGQTWQWNYKGATGGRTDYDPSGPILINNEWRHLCVTHDRDGNATFYVDGEAQGQVDISGSTGTMDPGLPTVIGTDGILGANYAAWLTAAIDEVKIFSYVLDPVEVALLYTTPSGKTACVELPEFDLNGDCEVNLKDIWLFQSKWLECYIVPTCIP